MQKRGRPANRQRGEDIAAIAFQQIAQDGFEGLRIRKVAAEAGISHATLLHYFPSKQSLVQGVVQGILRGFRGPAAAAGAAGRGARAAGRQAASALDELREEFADLERRMKSTPGLFAVLTELDMRARRDPGVAQVLSRLYGAWRTHLVSLFRKGIQSGTFRSDLDAKATALAMMVQVKAAGYHATGAPKEAPGLISTLARQVERWVTPQGPGKRRAGAR